MNTKSVTVLMVAAPSSGGGKTTLTLCLLAAFLKRGLRVGAIKTGPDYIDPAFHSALTKRAPLNIDSWCMGETLQNAIMEYASRDVDIVIIESAMGVFDGLMRPQPRRGSPSDIAARYGVPVLMILDMSGKGQSVGPIAKGFSIWSPDVSINAIILNRVASQRHKDLGLYALNEASLSCLGVMMRQKDHVLPERHLGLVQAREYGAGFAQWFEALAQKTEEELDIDQILAYARPVHWPQRDKSDKADFTAPEPPGQRIAVAHDDAFSFLYGHLSLFWRKKGAQFLPFSPLAGEAPDPSADICWLPGGYPELHCERLAQAEHFMEGLRAFGKTKPIYGECGGYMVLGEAIEDKAGKWHKMSGLLGHGTSFAKRKLHLGYREATLLKAHCLGPSGTVLRGHEFHYASYIPALTSKADEALFSTTNAYGAPTAEEGSCRGKVSGSFFHVLTTCSPG